MPYSFPSFKQMTETFDAQIELYKTHKKVSQVRDLDTHRQVPVDFLIAMKEQLQSSGEKNKPQIFAGACLLVQRWLVENQGWTTRVGRLHGHLNTVLGASSENQMSPENQQTAAVAFQQALFARVYTDKNPQKALLAHPSVEGDEAKHNFACFKLDQEPYTLSNFVNGTNQLVKEAGKAVQKAEADRLAAAAREEAGSGWGIFSGKPKDESKEQDETNALTL